MSLERRLDRSQRKVAILEGMIEEQTRELFLANERLASIIRATPSALIVAGSDGTIRVINEATRKMLGRGDESLVGARLEEIGAIACESASEQAWIGADGETIPVLVNCSTAGGRDGDQTILTGVDLRRRKKLEVELQHALKLESMAHLAAGIAHEINNPVQFITDSVEFLQESIDELLGEAPVDDIDFIRAQAPQACERALDGLRRVAEIVAAMKSLSHPGSEEMTIADVNQIVRDAVTVASNETKYIAEVETELGELPEIPCHVGDLGQVFLNLIVNGAHAIRDRLGEEQRGTISITTRVEGEAVVVSITDDGSGIPEAVQARIFDPFFTTKGVGEGSGQGLSISHAIIHDKHGGRLHFETAQGEGTTFYVEIPMKAARDE